MDHDARSLAWPASGRYADGFEPLVRTFAEQLASGEEVGAGLCVHQRGRLVVDVWGGVADLRHEPPVDGDTRIVVFSVTKGLAAMALLLLAERGAFDWDAPVATYWPGFARGGKHNVTVRTLLNHRAGLSALDQPLTLDDCTRAEGADRVRDALEAQRPRWRPDTSQGYHAITFGLYASELFQRIAGESMGTFLKREISDVVDSDARLGTPAELDANIATLVTPAVAERLRGMLRATFRQPRSAEARILRAIAKRHSLVRDSFANPRAGRRGLDAYNEPPVRRAELAWASATSSARGLSRAYLPFANGGRVNGRQLFRESSIAAVYDRQSWSPRDRVLQKSLGWSQGFLKEEPGVFGPTREAFGHAGMGGALGWADPVNGLSIGYVMNHMDWRIRSPRALALCRSLYACDPVRAT